MDGECLWWCINAPVNAPPRTRAYARRLATSCTRARTPVPFLGILDCPRTRTRSITPMNGDAWEGRGLLDKGISRRRFIIFFFFFFFGFFTGRLIVNRFTNNRWISIYLVCDFLEWVFLEIIIFENRIVDCLKSWFEVLTKEYVEDDSCLSCVNCFIFGFLID